MIFFRFVNHIYPEVLPIILLPTTSLGMFTGLTMNNNNNTSQIDNFIITFPISFPLRVI